MKRLIIMAVSLLLAACGQHRPINPGAKIEIHLAPLYVIQAKYKNVLDRPAAVTDGNTIWLPSDQGQAELVRMTIHEVLKHVVAVNGNSDSVEQAIELLETHSFPIWPCGKPVSKETLEARAKENVRNLE